MGKDALLPSSIVSGCSRLSLLRLVVRTLSRAVPSRAFEPAAPSRAEQSTKGFTIGLLRVPAALKPGACALHVVLFVGPPCGVRWAHVLL